MMKIFTKFLIMIALPMQLCAQSLSPSVIASAGDFFSNSSGSLSFTVAEMSMVQTFTATNNVLTQGFQQPEDNAVFIQENVVINADVSIYPNPTTGKFILNYIASDESSTFISIYNMVGEIVLSKKYAQSKGMNTVNFDISSMSQGIYMVLLHLRDNNGKLKPTYYKLNLIY